MNKIVLDASAVLACLNNEPGGDEILPYLGKTLISTVNYSEVLGKLIGRRIARNDAIVAIDTVVAEIVPFNRDQACITADLLKQTKPFGLSFGDRACLALGSLLQLPVYTTDKDWNKVQCEVEIYTLR